MTAPGGLGRHVHQAAVSATIAPSSSNRASVKASSPSISIVPEQAAHPTHHSEIACGGGAGHLGEVAHGNAEIEPGYSVRIVPSADGAVHHRIAEAAGLKPSPHVPSPREREPTRSTFWRWRHETTPGNLWRHGGVDIIRRPADRLGRQGFRVVRPPRPSGGLLPDAQRDALPASTMKVGVMAAAYRLADAGKIDLDAEVTVHNRFTSAVGGPFAMDPDYDNDPDVWARMGGTASLRWLTRRMIVRSSNLATNLVLEQVGYGAAQDAFRVGGDPHSITRRGIEDYAARDAGVDNEITAADLAAQLSAIHGGTMASRLACDEMLEVLRDQEINTDLAQGLPDGVVAASKNGWVTGIRHGAMIVYPEDSSPYVLVACASTPLARSSEGDDPVCRTFAQLSEIVWNLRHRLGSTARAA